MSYSSLDPPSYPSGSMTDSSGKSSYSSHQNVEGYDYEFTPALESRYECPICLLILREPRQTKCGHRFCKDCILRCLRGSCLRCPVDNEELTENDLFPDNFAKREILNFTVRCPHSKDGCETICPLGKLQNHLAECALALVPCPYRCASILPRGAMEDHVSNHCEHRLISCEKCFECVRVDRMKAHAEVCSKALATCLYCHQEIIRDEMGQHVGRACENVLVTCPFYSFGCQVSMPRNNEKDHLLSELPSHMKMLCNVMSKIIRQVNTLSASTFAEKRSPSPRRCESIPGTSNNNLDVVHWSKSLPPHGSSLNIEVDAEHMLSSSPAWGSVTDLLTPPQSTGMGPGLSKHNERDLRTNDSPLVIPQVFQTSGQKECQAYLSYSSGNSGEHNLCSWNSNSDSQRKFRGESLAVNVPAYQNNQKGQAENKMSQDVLSSNLNSDPQGLTPLSQLDQTQTVFAPANSSGIVKMLQEITAHYEEKFLEQEKKLEDLTQTMTAAEKVNTALAKKVKELESQKILDSEGRFYNGDFYWSIKDFSSFQQKAMEGEHSMLHSPAFYSSPWGYKMCLRVNLNTAITPTSKPHLSLFVHFMQGQNDAFLSWPFSGRIELTVMDQDPNSLTKMPIKETLVAKPHLAAFQRPTMPQNHKGFGYTDFMSLSLLHGKMYLQNDTLVIRALVFPESH